MESLHYIQMGVTQRYVEKRLLEEKGIADKGSSFFFCIHSVRRAFPFGTIPAFLCIDR